MVNGPVAAFSAGTDRSPPLQISPAIETIVIQPTPFCNINCSYCYLPSRNDKTVIEQSTVTAIFTKIFASGWALPQLTVIWHAGEPLVVPISFYRTAFEAIEALRPAALNVRHSFQTNGMLITQDWCDFFKEFHVEIGVSIDGPARFHDVYRKTRAGQGTFDRTIEGIRLLRHEEIPFHIISVLTQHSLDAPEEMLSFYLSEGIENICFNVEESEGDHVSDLLAITDLRSRFHSFLNRFWSLSRQTDKIRFIREIDGMLPRIFRPDQTDVGNVQVRPFGMLNIDCLGNVSSFSPELLGYKNADYNDFIIGNINVDSLEQMRQSPAMKKMSNDIQAGVEECRANCDYYSVCGGGAPVNKLFENGSFRSAATSFCSLIQMVPTDIILDAFDRLGERLEDAESLLSSRASDFTAA